MPGKETDKIRSSEWWRKHIVILCLEVQEVDSVPTVTDVLVAMCTCVAGAITERVCGCCWHMGCALYVLRDLPRPAVGSVPQSSTAERNLWVLLRQNFSVKSISSLMTLKELLYRRRRLVGEAKSEGSGQEAFQPGGDLGIISKESVDESVCAALTRMRELVQSEHLSGRGRPAASLHHQPAALQVSQPMYPYLSMIAPEEEDERINSSTRAKVEKKIEAVRGKKGERRKKKAAAAAVHTAEGGSSAATETPPNFK